MKIKISLLLLLIIGTVACTRNKTCTNWLFRPETCQITTFPMSHIDTNTGLEKTDSMFLNLILSGKNIENCAAIPSLSFGAEIMAEPPIPLIKWEKALVSFEIKSNQDFNEIPAGQSLKNKLFAQSFTGNNEKISVDTYLQPFIDNVATMEWDYFRFQFSEIPAKKVHIFTITLTLADGQILEAVSENVEWK